FTSAQHRPSPSFFFNAPATTVIYPLSLHDALPISGFSKAQTTVAYSAYLALAANAIFFEKKPIAIGLIAVLAIAHILKKKPALKLLYFKGCPTYPELQRELDSRGLSYQEIDLERLRESDPLRKHSSPTLVFRKEILRSEEHTSELQSRENLVCRLLLEKQNVGR